MRLVFKRQACTDGTVLLEGCPSGESYTFMTDTNGIVVGEIENIEDLAFALASGNFGKEAEVSAIQGEAVSHAAISEPTGDEFSDIDSMDKGQLRAFADTMALAYHHKTGEGSLRAMIKAHIEGAGEEDE